MTIAAKREKLHDFISTADDEQVKAAYSIFESEIANKYDHWEDEDFLANLKSRIDDYENGTDKGMSWEEAKLKAKSEFEAKHQ